MCCYKYSNKIDKGDPCEADQSVGLLFVYKFSWEWFKFKCLLEITFLNIDLFKSKVGQTDLKCMFS